MGGIYPWACKETAGGGAVSPLGVAADTLCALSQVQVESTGAPLGAVAVHSADRVCVI